MKLIDTEDYRLIDFSFVVVPPDRYAVIRIPLWQRFLMWCSRVARTVLAWTR